KYRYGKTVSALTWWLEKRYPVVTGASGSRSASSLRTWSSRPPNGHPRNRILEAIRSWGNRCAAGAGGRSRYGGHGPRRREPRDVLPERDDARLVQDRYRERVHRQRGDPAGNRQQLQPRPLEVRRHGRGDDLGHAGEEP